MIRTVGIDLGKSVSRAIFSANVAIHKTFRPGSYFVRLYTSKGDLMHEYGFTVLPQNP